MRRLALILAAVLALAAPAYPATFNVTDAGDDGDDTPGDAACATAGAACTLRACIDEAEALAGDDTCNVAALTITPATNLTTIASNLTITGCAAAGASANDILAGTDHVLTAEIVGGTGLAYGLRVDSGVVTIRCLEITGFDDVPGFGAAGIKIYGGVVAVESNILAENGHGVETRGGFVTIGGLTTGKGNIIRDSVVDGVFCSGNPTPITGPAVVGNVLTGNEDNVYLDQCNDTAIGGGSTSHRNVISGATHYGIDIVDSHRTGIGFNRIGTSRDGTTADPNADDGILITGTSQNTLIGPSNLISGNTEWGITNAATTSWTTATGNQIGLNAAGTPNLCNGLGNYQDLDAGDFAENTVCPATPTPTPTAQGCCNYQNAQLPDGTPLTCGDDTFMGSLPDAAACYTAAASVPVATPGPGTPGPTVSLWVAGVTCSDPFGGACAVTNTPTITPTPTVTQTGTITPTPASSPTATTGCPAVVPGTTTRLSSTTTMEPAAMQALPSLTNTLLCESEDESFFLLLKAYVQTGQENDAPMIRLRMTDTGDVTAPVELAPVLPPGAETLVTLSQTVYCASLGLGTHTFEIEAQKGNGRGLMNLGTRTSFAITNFLTTCVGGGGAGAGFSQCLDEVVTLTAAPTATTVATLAARAQVAGCYAQNVTAVTGGYTVGLAGAPLGWGTVAATLGASNEASLTFSQVTRMVATQGVLLTRDTAGNFTAGQQARVTCYCATNEGAP